MSDPVMEAYTLAYNESEQKIGAFGVITTSGEVLWQSDTWDLSADAKGLVAAVLGKAASVTQNQVKYVTLKSSPENIVARNVGGNGILVVALIEGDKWVCAWASADGVPNEIYFHVDKAARSLKGKV